VTELAAQLCFEALLNAGLAGRDVGEPATGAMEDLGG